jgi:hypothetical protein
LASLSTSYSNLKNIFRRNSPHFSQSLTFLYFDIAVGPGGVSILTHIDQLFYCVDLLDGQSREIGTYIQDKTNTMRKQTQITLTITPLCVIRMGLEPTIYSTPGENANHYTTVCDQNGARTHHLQHSRRER